ncbi:MAG: alkaline phosphatase family protein [Opitutaceae bacterium]
MTSPLRFPLLAAFVALLAPAAFSAEPPRLAVVIVIDQFRGDYLARFGPHFSDGGFRRLLANGVNYTQCHYRHGITLTAPGHATVLTGATPDVHGITANDWLDRTTWEMRNCVEDPASPLVGIAPAELGPVAAAAPDKTGRSPRPLLAATVSDELKKRFGPKARVFAVSNKDRSAILLGGQQADGAYWDENGRFITSRHYRAELPAWVRAFNAEGRVVARFGATWDRLLEREVYDRIQGPDDEAGEADTAGLGRTFPRRITGGLAKPGPAFFTAFDNSPFSAEFLGEFARRVVTEEKLGRGETIDLLGVSFSQVDTAGHKYGPDSHEVMDSVVRIDRTLAMLLDHLDREVGLARCVFAFTADHGIMPLP